MSIRIRKDGEMLCAAMHPAQAGDVYIDDAVHAFLTGADGRIPIDVAPLRADCDHKVSGVWHWRHQPAPTEDKI